MREFISKPLMKFALVMLLSLFSLGVFAQTDEDADREHLRGMLASVEQAINDRDLSGVINFFTPDSVVVFQNKTVLHGPEDLSEFFEKMLGDENSVLTDIKSTASLGAPAQFYSATTAVAQGELLDTYSFRGGSSMDLSSVWTTTVVKVDDEWKIASLHFSANVFDNAVLDNSKRFILWAALAGLLVGVLLTWILMRRGRKIVK